MSDILDGHEEDPEGAAALPENAPPSAVDEPQRRRRESKAERKRREDREFFQFVAQHEAGRRLLWSILNDTLHAFEVRFGYTPSGAPHDEATWMQFGEQQAGQRLHLTWYERSPENMMRMVIENDPRFASGVP